MSKVRGRFSPHSQIRFPFRCDAVVQEADQFLAAAQPIRPRGGQNAATERLSVPLIVDLERPPIGNVPRYAIEIAQTQRDTAKVIRYFAVGQNPRGSGGGGQGNGRAHAALLAF
jgi:hypothetical protein